MNYGELKAAVARFISRGDLTADMDTLRDLAEQEIYYGCRDPQYPFEGLRIRAMEASTTSGLPALPTGFLEAKSLVAGSCAKPLQFRTADQFARLDSTSSEPAYYTYQDGQLAVYGGTPTDYTLRYYAKLATPSADADENWIMANASGIYLFGMLKFAATLTKSPAALTYGQQLAAQINALKATDTLERLSGAPLTIPNPY